ncbi:MAG: hypothetical protein RMH75_05385 [Archaeoglobaceae archaeon]|nr:hypothetical protein [Archaeoglobaceae archaeon]MDW7990076.1 hypothetical protein [Archaeoglobaceae archaeon]
MLVTDKLQNLSAITEGDKIILVGEENLAVSPDDVLLERRI